mgnify:CR=1 FL=1
MRYMGSKARHAQSIVQIIMESHTDGATYYEPFLGGGNMFSAVPIPLKVGSDLCRYSVATLRAISTGWIPPDVVSEADYREIMNNKGEYPDHLVGFVGYCCSYAGKFFGGYARGVSAKGVARNFAAEQVRNLEKQRDGLAGASFLNCGYSDVIVPDGSTVYCDPPYSKTTGYSVKFDHDRFWDWAKSLSGRCNVFVSEYNAPREWTSVWSCSVNNSLTKNTGSKAGVEQLYTIIK